MTVTLRPYQPADLDRCMEIWWAASRHAHSFLGEDELAADAALVRAIYMPNAEVIVAERKDRVLGFIALIEAFVGGLFVDPQAHRQGIGRSLMRQASRLKGALTLEAYVVNEGARAFYRTLGYREILCQITDDWGRPYPLVRITNGEEIQHAHTAMRTWLAEFPELAA